MSPPEILTSILRGARVLWHACCGRIAFHAGLTSRSRRHFERVLDFGGDSFTAYVYLGRIALRSGDLAGAQRELLHAQRIDPERFQRLEPWLLPASGGRTPSQSEAGARATWRSVVAGGPVGRGIPAPTEFEIGDWNAPDWTADDGKPTAPLVRNRRGDDFADDRERGAFAGRPPITRAEVEAVDLDDLCSRF
ncbi:MAG: hypothetical protein Fur0037_26310 [Planctomycetota bacterium]